MVYLTVRDFAVAVRLQGGEFNVFQDIESFAQFVKGRQRWGALIPYDACLKIQSAIRNATIYKLDQEGALIARGIDFGEVDSVKVSREVVQVGADVSDMSKFAQLFVARPLEEVVDEARVKCYQYWHNVHKGNMTNIAKSMNRDRTALYRVRQKWMEFKEQ